MSIKNMFLDVVFALKPVAIWKYPTQVKTCSDESKRLIQDFEELDCEARDSIRRNGFAKILILEKEDYDKTHPNG